MFDRIGKLLKDRRGAVSIEYGLILVLVLLAIMLALVALANQTIGMWNNFTDKVVTAG